MGSNPGSSNDKHLGSRLDHSASFSITIVGKLVNEFNPGLHIGTHSSHPIFFAPFLTIL